MNSSCLICVQPYFYWSHGLDNSCHGLCLPCFDSYSFFYVFLIIKEPRDCLWTVFEISLCHMFMEAMNCTVDRFCPILCLPYFYGSHGLDNSCLFLSQCWWWCTCSSLGWIRHQLGQSSEIFCLMFIPILCYIMLILFMYLVSLSRRFIRNQIRLMNRYMNKIIRQKLMKFQDYYFISQNKCLSKKIFWRNFFLQCRYCT